MTATSPKVSKYRWTQGQAAKVADEMPVEPSGALNDCGNLLAASSKFVAVPWQSVGCAGIVAHEKVGVRGYRPPKVVGHKGHIIDLAFSPFHSDILFTGSEDSTVKAWRIPDGVDKDITTPLITLEGHAKKIGILAPHPSADNVLATAGMDNVVNVYDVTNAAPKFSIQNVADQMMSLNWNLDGSLLNCTSKDKNVYIFDSRSGAVAAKTPGNPGAKTMRSLWLKRRNEILTLGFNKNQYRQMMLFDVRDMSKPKFVHEVDQMSNVMMGFFDEDTNMLYAGGRGEAGIKYFEIWDEAQMIVPLNAYSGGDPQKGLANMPKDTLRVKDCELQKFYKLSTTKLTTVSFTLPRRQGATQFQADIYPNTFASQPAMQADDFFAGKNATPAEMSLASLFDGGDAVVATVGQLSAPTSPVKKPGDLSQADIDQQRKKVAELEAQVAAEKTKLAEMEKKYAAQQSEAGGAAAAASSGAAAAAAASSGPATPIAVPAAKPAAAVEEPVKAAAEEPVKAAAEEPVKAAAEEPAKAAAEEPAKTE